MKETEILSTFTRRLQQEREKIKFGALKTLKGSGQKIKGK